MSIRLRFLSNLQKQRFDYVIPYQIDCSIASNEHFCKDIHKIDSFPDVVVFKNGKITDYFQRKYNEFTFSNMNLFLKSIGNLNPFKKKIQIPENDIGQCCKAIVVTGDNLGPETGEGKYFLKSLGSTIKSLNIIA